MSDAAANEKLLADLLCAEGLFPPAGEAARQIVKTRDNRTLGFLSARRGDIEAAMGSVEYWHRSNLETVLKKLTFVESRDGCWCAMYPLFGSFQVGEERDAGHIRVVQQSDSAPYTAHYVCECVECGTRYDVEESTDLHARGSKWMSKETLLADLLSGDEDRLRTAARRIITTRDADLLTLLASRRAEIEEATRGLEFALMPWMRGHIDFILAKLSFFASRAGCLCRLYPRHDGFIPVVESSANRISLVQKNDSREPGEATHYVCRCVDCGTRYDVQEHAGSSPWWDWKVHEPRRRFWRTH